jgi:hypothetical protein
MDRPFVNANLLGTKIVSQFCTTQQKLFFFFSPAGKNLQAGTQQFPYP